MIVFSDGMDLLTVRADGRMQRRLSDLQRAPGHDPPPYLDPAFSPDGREVVAVARGHSGPSSLARFEIGGDDRARGVPGVRSGDMPIWAPRPGGR